LPALETFKSDPISFTYIQASEELYIHQEVFASSKAVLYKPKRNKFMALPIDSLQTLESAISDALGGGGSWNKSKELEFGRGLGV